MGKPLTRYETVYLLGGIADGQVKSAPANARLIPGSDDEGHSQLYQVVTYVAPGAEYLFGIPADSPSAFVLDTLVSRYFKDNKARLN